MTKWEMSKVNVREKCATSQRTTPEWIPLVERGQAAGVPVQCDTTLKGNTRSVKKKAQFD